MTAFEQWLHGTEVDDIILAHVTFSGRVLGLERGASALLANGRVSEVLTLYCTYY